MDYEDCEKEIARFRSQSNEITNINRILSVALLVCIVFIIAIFSLYSSKLETQYEINAELTNMYNNVSGDYDHIEPAYDYYLHNAVFVSDNDPYFHNYHCRLIHHTDYTLTVLDDDVLATRTPCPECWEYDSVYGSDSLFD